MYIYISKGRQQRLLY